MIATEKTALLTVPKGERCTQGHMEKHLAGGGRTAVRGQEPFLWFPWEGTGKAG